MLLDADGERFVDELAPRDEVSRAIDALLARTGARSVSLDMRDVDPALFPNVVDALAEAGIDVTRELIPVAPAAHFMMGGITHRPARSLDAAGALRGRGVGLHRPARGQPARLQLAERVLRLRRRVPRAPRSPRPALRAARPATAVTLVAGVSPATRTALWQHAGLRRTQTGLERLLEDPYPLARLIAACALARERKPGRPRPRGPPADRPAARRDAHDRRPGRRRSFRALGLAAAAGPGRAPSPPPPGFIARGVPVA